MIPVHGYVSYHIIVSFKIRMYVLKILRMPDFQLFHNFIFTNSKNQLRIQYSNIFCLFYIFEDLNFTNLSISIKIRGI